MRLFILPLPRPFLPLKPSERLPCKGLSSVKEPLAVLLLPQESLPSRNSRKRFLPAEPAVEKKRFVLPAFFHILMGAAFFQINT